MIHFTKSAAARYFLSSAGWCVLSAIFARLGMLVAIVLVARTLGSEAVGLISLVQTTVFVAGALLGIGLGMAVARYLTESTASGSADVGGGIALFSAATLVTLALGAIAITLGAGWLAGLMHDPRLESLLVISGPLLFFTGWQQYQSGLLTGLRAFRTLAVANGAASIAALILVAAAVYLHDLILVFWSLTIAGGIACAITQVFVHRHCVNLQIRPSFRSAWAQRSLLWQIGLPCLMLNMVNVPTDWISFQMLTQYAGGVAELGIYSAANQWCLLVRFIPLAAASAILPLVAATSGDASRESSHKTIGLSLIAAIATSWPLCLVMCLASPWIMAWHGPEFAPRWLVFVLVVVGGGFVAIQMTAERVLVAFDKTWSAFWLRVMFSVLFCGSLALTAQWGANALAATRTASFLVHACVTVLAVLLVVRQRASRETNNPLPVPLDRPYVPNAA